MTDSEPYHRIRQRTYCSYYNSIGLFKGTCNLYVIIGYYQGIIKYWL